MTTLYHSCASCGHCWHSRQWPATRWEPACEDEPQCPECGGHREGCECGECSDATSTDCNLGLHPLEDASWASPTDNIELASWEAMWESAMRRRALPHQVVFRCTVTEIVDLPDEALEES